MAVPQQGFQQQPGACLVGSEGGAVFRCSLDANVPALHAFTQVLHSSRLHSQHWSPRATPVPVVAELFKYGKHESLLYSLRCQIHSCFALSRSMGLLSQSRSSAQAVTTQYVCLSLQALVLRRQSAHSRKLYSAVQSSQWCVSMLGRCMPLVPPHLTLPWSCLVAWTAKSKSAVA